MKKIFSAAAAILAIMSCALCGCSKSSAELRRNETKEIIVGASPMPHAQILEEARSELKERGYDLVIKEYTDYVQPNMALKDDYIDANFFQHEPYLDNFNREHGTDLVSVGAIHYEPFGIYSRKIGALSELRDGAIVAIPNDVTNEARALLLLEDNGLLEVNENKDLLATKNDITQNPKNLVIKEIESAQLARSLGDVDIAVINGNFAILAGFSVINDNLAIEPADSKSAERYANVVVFRAANVGCDKTKALMSALKSDKVKQFIIEKYGGAILPVF
jgi:D-methionine transport system substrate-binding protein